MKIRHIALLVCAINFSASAQWVKPQIQSPSVIGMDRSQVKGDFNKLEQKLEKQLLFDPIIEVNTNRGSMSTGFVVPLPPNLLKFLKLEFSYNPGNILNANYGIGWSLKLPEIEEERNVLTTKPYRISGQLGNSQMIATGESLDLQDSLIQSVIVDQFGSGGTVTEAFRPIIESDFNLFVKVKRNGLHIGWVSLSLNGNQWIFNREGFPLRVRDLDGNQVNFNFNGHTLNAITYGDGITISFDYLEQQSLPVVIHGKLRNAHKGLNSILIKNDAGEEKKVVFQYEDEYLEKVRWERGKSFLFKGEYERLNALVADTVSNPLVKFDNRIPVFLNNTEAPDFTATPIGKKNDMYIDLNGDNIPDKVMIDKTGFESDIKSVFNKIAYPEGNISGSSVGSCVARPNRTAAWIAAELNKLAPVINVYIGVRDLQTGEVEFKSDPSLNLTPLKIKLDHFVVKDKVTSNGSCGTIHSFEVETYSRGFFFIDLNSDGRKDLVSCPCDAGLESRVFELNGGSFQYEGETIKRKQSNLNMSVLALLGYPEVSGKPYINVFNSNGAKGAIYFNQINDSKVEQIWEQVRGTDDERLAANYLTNSSGWVQSNADFNCNQFSFFSDVNSDGYLDILSGKNLYLFGHEGLSKIPSATYLNRLFEKGDDQIDLQNDDLVLTDIDSDGKFEPRQARSVYTHPVDGTLNVARAGKTEVHKPVPVKKYLKKIISPYNGELLFDYKFVQGRWVVSSIIKDSKTPDQPISKRTFEYNSSQSDPYRGVFLGFHKTIEHEELISRDGLSYSGSSPISILREFYLDTANSVIVFESRGRLNGTLKSLTKKNSSKSGFLQTEQYELDFHTLDSRGRRILPYKKKLIKTRSNDHGQLGLSSAEVRKSIPYGGWQPHVMIPLKETKETITRGPLTNIFDQTENSLRWEVTNYSYTFLPKLYMRSLEEIKKGDKRGNQIIYNRHSNRMRINGTNGRLDSVLTGKRWVKYEYDVKGRIISQRTSMGELSVAEYFPLSPSVKKYKTQKDELTYSYDLLGRTTSSTNEDGINIATSYSDEGFIEEISRATPTRPRIIFYKTDIPDFNNDEAKNAVSFWEEEIEKSVILDGFGKKIRTLTRYPNGVLNSGLNISTGKSVLVEGAPFFTNNLNPDSSIVVKKTYDALNRLVKRQTFDKDGNLIQHFTRTYRGNCIEDAINFTTTFVKCNDGHNETIFTSTRGERAEMKTNSFGDIGEVSNMGLKWDYSRYGEVTSTVNESESEEHADWSVGLNKINEQGTITTTEDGLIIEKRFDNKLLRTYKNAGIDDSDVFENIDYNGDLIVSHKYSDAQGNQILRRDYTYNDLKLIVTSEMLGISSLFSYDDFGRLTKEKVTNRGDTTTLIKKYKNGFLNALDPLIKRVEYDEFGAPSKFVYSNDVVFNITRDRISKKIKFISYSNSSGNLIWKETLDFNSFNQVIERASFTLEDTLREQFSYDDQGHLISPDHVDNESRDRFGQVKSLSGSNFKWINENLVNISGEIRLKYDANHSLLTTSNKTTGDVLIKYNQDSYLYNGELIKLIKIHDIPVGLLIQNRLYITMVDHIGSVTGLIDLESGKPIFIRRYDAWGNKTIVKGTDPNLSKELEHKTIWSFAGLTENPVLKNTSDSPDLYWSSSRVYSPLLKEWVSVDPTIKWHPKQLANRPGNWHSTRYSANQPLDLVDPQGSGFVVGAIGGAVVGGIGGGIAAYAMGKDMDKIWSSVALGAFTGAVVGSGLGLLTSAGITSKVGLTYGGMNLGFKASLLGQSMFSDNVSIEQAAVDGLLGGLSGVLAGLTAGSSYGQFVKTNEVASGLITFGPTIGGNMLFAENDVFTLDPEIQEILDNMVNLDPPDIQIAEPDIDSDLSFRFEMDFGDWDNDWGNGNDNDTDNDDSWFDW
ncbi:MAG: hypothetical protein RIM99_10045 [Cyclobacteriaceae bacterium]